MWCDTCQQEIPRALDQQSGIPTHSPTASGRANAAAVCVTSSVANRNVAVATAAGQVAVSPPDIGTSERPAPDTSALRSGQTSAKRINSADVGESNITADRPSLTLSQRVERIDQLRREIEQNRQQSADGEPGTANGRVTGFFVVFFLFGQAISTWAFISAHFAAWVCGIGFSLIGLTIAMFSLLNQIDSNRQEISQLRAQLTENANPQPHSSDGRRPHFPVESVSTERATA